MKLESYEKNKVFKVFDRRIPTKLPVNPLEKKLEELTLFMEEKREVGTKSDKYPT